MQVLFDELLLARLVVNGVQLGVVGQEIDVVAVDGYTAVFSGDEVDVVATERRNPIRSRP